MALSSSRIFFAFIGSNCFDDLPNRVNPLNVLSIGNFKLRIAELDRRLRPIADRPVDITKPGWGARLVQGPHPLDEAGVLREADLLLNEVIAFYRANSDDCRQAIRQLFQENRPPAAPARFP